MKKKNVMYSFIAFILAILFMGKETILGAVSDETNVKEIVEGLQSENIKIDEWNIYVKSPMPMEKNSEKTKLTQNHFRQYKWRKEIHGEMTKWIGEHRNDKFNMKETLQIVTTQINHHSESYVLYQASFDGWQGEKWGEISQYFSQEILKHLNGNRTIFTCVKGHTSDNMESVLQFKAERILDKFRAKPVEALTESDFVSISGYTTRWDQALPTENGKMNIQVALRNVGMGGRTTVVVGTPIITNEY